MTIPEPNEFAKKAGYQPFPPRWESWLSSIRAALLSAQPTAGRHVTTDEHRGKGTVINVLDRRLGPPSTPIGACCVGEVCSIKTEADCATAGGIWQGAGTDCDPNPCGCIVLHTTVLICYQNLGDPCSLNVSETIYFDIPLQCPLDLGTSGPKGCIDTSLTTLSSQAWTGAGCDPAIRPNITGAYFDFYPSGCINHDVSTGWSFTPSLVFPNWPFTQLATSINPGFGDLRTMGTIQSDPSDGPCPCDVSNTLCSHFEFTFT